ncbi:VOC family protein [Streptomyces sp. NPDC056638]|uniref:VOC family protein n=1 Tax=Streptomyces sp. NPDC056638 TaxID=3345887 RepID=UPI0036B0CF32
MSRHIQVTFDAHDPRALSSFWRDVLGYVHPGPPGVGLPEGADPLAAWDDFLARVGVPEEQRNSKSAIEDPDGHGPRVFFQQVPEDKVAKNRVHLDVRAAPGRQGEERMAGPDDCPVDLGGGEDLTGGGGVEPGLQDGRPTGRPGSRSCADSSLGRTGPRSPA